MITILKESGEHNTTTLLITDGEKFAVVQWCNASAQVFGATNKSGTRLFHRGRTEEALSYVAKWTTRPTALERFKSLSILAA